MVEITYRALNDSRLSIDLSLRASVVKKIYIYILSKCILSRYLVVFWGKKYLSFKTLVLFCKLVMLSYSSHQPQLRSPFLFFTVCLHLKLLSNVQNHVFTGQSFVILSSPFVLLVVCLCVSHSNSCFLECLYIFIF